MVGTMYGAPRDTFSAVVCVFVATCELFNARQVERGAGDLDRLLRATRNRRCVVVWAPGSLPPARALRSRGIHRNPGLTK